MARDEIQLTPAERRALRRVFHRQALPYLAGLLLFAFWMAPSEPEPVEEAIPAEALAARVEAAVAAAERERVALAGLRVELEHRVEELVQAVDREKTESATAVQKAAALERRLGAAAKRLASIEAEAGRAATGRDEALAANGADLIALRERVAALESTAAGLEARILAGLKGRDAAPAAPFP